MKTEQRLRSMFEIKLVSSVKRAEQTDVIPVVPNHYFSAASSEIREMFIAGYFIGMITLSQSVAEGLSRFLCARNGLKGYLKQKHSKRVVLLLSENIISHESKTAFDEIAEWRNDFHHMNENIKTNRSELESKAKINIDCLFQIEKEIFDYSFSKGELVPKYPQYWDISADGTTEAFLRSLP